jgi:hypothetical protein
LGPFAETKGPRLTSRNPASKIRLHLNFLHRYLPETASMTSEKGKLLKESPPLTPPYKGGEFQTSYDAGMATHPRLHPRNPRKAALLNHAPTHCFLRVYWHARIWQGLCDRPFPFTIAHGKEVKVFQANGETSNQK